MSKLKKTDPPPLSKRLLEILVCPVSGGSLVYDAKQSLLFCAKSGLAYPVRDGIPVMLVEEAKRLSASKNKMSPKASS